jgi:hypothetical protein
LGRFDDTSQRLKSFRIATCTASLKKCPDTNLFLNVLSRPTIPPYPEIDGSWG